MITYNTLKINTLPVDYINSKEILDKYNVWSDIDSKDINNKIYIDKISRLIAYLESQNYLKNTIELHDIKIIPREIIEYNNSKIFYKLKNFLIYSLKTNKKIFTISIILNFDYEIWLNNGNDYNYLSRGNSFIQNKLTSRILNNIGDVLFGSGFNSIPILSIADKIKNTNLIILILNLPNIFISEYNLNIYKLLKQYNVKNKFIIPKEVYTYNNVDNIYTQHKLLEYKNNINTISYEFEYYNNTYNIDSFYQLLKSIDNNTINYDCSKILSIKLPTNAFSIPTSLIVNNDIINIRNTFLVSKFNLDTSLLLNYKKGYIDTVNNIYSYLTLDNKLFICCTDKFNNEQNIIKSDNFTNVNINSKSYYLLTEVNKFYNLDNMFTTLDINPNEFNNDVLIYGFGSVIYSFLRDFINICDNLNPSKISLYLEGLPSVTKNFTSFNDIYNILDEKYYSINIWQDPIVNNKTKINNLDLINVKKVYDDKDSNNMEFINCLHSIYAYMIKINLL